MSQNQNQGNVQGDEKNKEKSPMAWHRINNSHHCDIWFGIRMEGIELDVAEAKEDREAFKRTRPSRE
ncbi:hypothetical protein MTR_2g055480 [Medicago truncatula]|uniref:Uncharacterized protein n=1 Tax=Medicago truncatula TaxID=3880 RepID=A0A072V9F5_MEDTR|nr:hypothetical protein MTR_2g055480 [Medicago truncatula]